MLAKAHFIKLEMFACMFVQICELLVATGIVLIKYRNWLN